MRTAHDAGVRACEVVRGAIASQQDPRLDPRCRALVAACEAAALAAPGDALARALVALADSGGALAHEEMLRMFSLSDQIACLQRLGLGPGPGALESARAAFSRRCRRQPGDSDALARKFAAPWKAGLAWYLR